MSFVARLRPELIRVAPPWRTFEETISGLVAVLAGERLLPAAVEGAAFQAVTAREERAERGALGAAERTQHQLRPVRQDDGLRVVGERVVGHTRSGW